MVQEQGLDIKGRIYISAQGINAQVGLTCCALLCRHRAPRQESLTCLPLRYGIVWSAHLLECPCAASVLDLGVHGLQLSGPKEGAMEYARWVKTDPRFADVVLQVLGPCHCCHSGYCAGP